MRIYRQVVRLALLGLAIVAVVAMHHVAGPAPSGTDSAPSAAAHVVTSTTPGLDIHVAPPGDGQHGHGETTGSGTPSHSPVDHLISLCLAALTAATLTAILWILTSRMTLLVMPRLRHWVRLAVPRRPPPRQHGFALLLTLCVIRT
ncbi:hypothetical protein [Phytoactinopolyspora endophytica]|uniref:hypothetical protein n=1 Tax=Phytoactinopolyspora endophytica TaxID=1642495 RepID=UPI00101C8157|nr:hypothetical protein [Phytoactinopolyspora endophytica]